VGAALVHFVVQGRQHGEGGRADHSPSAYSLITWPACGMLTPMSRAWPMGIPLTLRFYLSDVQESSAFFFGVPLLTLRPGSRLHRRPS
jgi:hypothetical protein